MRPSTLAFFALCFLLLRAVFPNLDDSTPFFGVYNRHGGKAVSKFCAKHDDLPTSIHKAFLRMDEMMKGQRGWRQLNEMGEKGSGNKITDMLEGIIWPPKGGASDKLEDSWVSEEAPNSHFLGPTSGSRACVAVIRNYELIVANAGDSRCVNSGLQLSTDHKLELEGEKERILNTGGCIVAGRVNGNLNVTRAIGDLELKQNEMLPTERQVVTAGPELKTVKLFENDEFIVFACDGLWDCMSSQQVPDFIGKCMETEKLSVVCGKLIDCCLGLVSGGAEKSVATSEEILAKDVRLASHDNLDALLDSFYSSDLDAL